MHRRKLLGSGAVKMTCPAGTTAVSIAHAPMQRPDYFFSSPACSRGCGLDPLHLLPSPTVSMPKNGAWNGAPGRKLLVDVRHGIRSAGDLPTVCPSTQVRCCTRLL
ncbi:hypothetical protein B0T24DRAFT_716563 [Lasiosphaeria ovina]|uniref:Uncharacterized protein n=1 Tax=Lasiosphaeria ovina TaxID=92902 RepID=A0AAE0NCZ8_9PEZI|nr:hypothetical protein B0T24DRAFT_716563 [Lasiosphaeria ovina]